MIASCTGYNVCVVIMVDMATAYAGKWTRFNFSPACNTFSAIDQKSIEIV